MKTYVPVSNEELEDVVPTAYRTADFEFVALALAYRNPEIDVVDIIPYDDPKRTGYKSRRFIFALVGKEDDWYKKLEDLAFQYVNGSTLIEPMLLGAKRKLLRAMMLNHPTSHGSRENRRDRK